MSSHRFLFSMIVLLMLLAFGAALARADAYVANVQGNCPPGQSSLQATIDFTPTGGNFANHTGTATVRFTLENTSGLIPFQSTAIGNPILTSFYFNVPPGTSVSYVDAYILAGSTLHSTGTVIAGIPILAGCSVTPVDLLRTSFYQLLGSSSTGQYGMFTNSLQTEAGVSGGLVDPEVFVACVKQGDFFSPFVIGGRVRFTLSLGNLGTDLDSATEFQNQCSLVSGQRDPSSFAGKFQGTGQGGEGSCFNGINCGPTDAARRTWGAVKQIYR